MNATTFFAFLGAAYLFGIATTVALLSAILAPVDGIERSGCFMRGVIMTCIGMAVYLIWLGVMQM